MTPSFVVLVPVKSPRVGKSRLAALGPAAREALALAFAEDTVAAASATPGVRRVVVSTGDRHVASRMRACGCDVVPDPGGLNEALSEAARWAGQRWPGARLVALCGDLPALTSTDLAAALGAVAADDGAAVVVDHHGTGTTLYTAPYDLFDPRFGPGSAARHEEAGARALAEALTTLRLDVDDPEDLGRACALGVGARTAAALAPR